MAYCFGLHIMAVNSSLKKTFQLLVEDLNRDKTEIGKQVLVYYNLSLLKLKQDFHQVKINSPELQNSFKQLLDALELSSIEQERYLNGPVTLHDVLTEIITSKPSSEKIMRLQNFLKKINSIEAQLKKALLFIGLMTLIMTGAFAPLLIAHGTAVIGIVLGVGFLIPIVGLAYTLAVGLYSTFQTLTDRSLSLVDKFRDNLFLFASSALNIAGYVALIVAAASASPFAGVLFVSAYTVNFIRDVVRLIQVTYSIYKTNHREQPNPYWAARAVNEQKNLMGRVFIDLIASLSLIGIITAWCFVPVGAAGTIGAIAGIGLVFGIKLLASTLNNRYFHKQLQKQLDQIELDSNAPGSNSSLENSAQKIPRPRANRTQSFFLDTYFLNRGERNSTLEQEPSQSPRAGT